MELGRGPGGWHTRLGITVGQFSPLPDWAKDRKLGRSTYNCHSEIAATKNSFRTAWKRAQHCTIPARAIYEPIWHSGKAVPTRIERAHGGPKAIVELSEEFDEKKSYQPVSKGLAKHADLEHVERDCIWKKNLIV